MIRVWTDSERAGVLDRLDRHGATFAYDPIVPPSRAASLTMPVRAQSWDVRTGLLPVFEMNLPEGALRARLTRRFAKAAGTFDEIDLLSVVGRTQIGRIRYSGIKETLSEAVPLHSVNDILRARRDGGLFDYLLEEFAEHSGLSGVQPKVMIRATGKASDPHGRQSPSIQSATHIVKFWDEGEFPELAANEFFCLSAARKLGLEVPEFKLSEDGGALVIERFDLNEGAYLGFEDFCVLNGFRTADKYNGGYERRLFNRLRQFVSSSRTQTALQSLFRLFVLNCAIRNGDAHLKNFGILYKAIDADIDIAPVYDLITTWAYLPNDPMALTFEGSTTWPDQRKLLLLGQTRADLTQSQARTVLEDVADALASVAPALRSYFHDKPHEVGNRMIAAWEAGIHDSLGLIRNLKTGKLQKIERKPRIARSDAAVLELLRQSDGVYIGTQAALATRLAVPQTTLSGTLKRLVERGLIQRTARQIKLVSHEV